MKQTTRNKQELKGQVANTSCHEWV